MKASRVAIVFATGLLLGFSICSSAGENIDFEQRVLVIGNSLTMHGPAPEIGWTGMWGMAASAAENDYVSQLIKLLSERDKPVSWRANRLSSNDLEKTPEKFRLPVTALQLSRNAALVIIEAGDNVPPTSLEAFAASYLEALKSLRPPSGILVCVSTWWSSPLKDKIIRDNCRVAGGVYVDIARVSNTPENVAGNERHISHQGVAAHPGDKGMKVIADRIFNAIRK